MNPIETIERDIQQALPATWTRLRRPRKPDGEWWLDAKMDDHSVTVQWSRRRGFGVSASALGDGYGEGPEETFDEPRAVTKRVLQLLRTRGNTVPPYDVLLREVRARLGVTQEQLAERLGVQQAAISRMERREDITLSSLRRFLAGLGAKLEINIETPAGETLRLSEPGEVKQRAACVHFDSAHAEAVPMTDMHLALDACKTWLSTFENAVRIRWSLRCDRLVLRTHSAHEIASSQPSLGIIALDLAKVSRLALDVSRGVKKTNRPASELETIQLVCRHLLAHEVGHCVEDDSLRAEPAFRQLENGELRAEAVAGWLAAAVGDGALIGASLSNRLGCRIAHCSHPTPEERSFAYLSGHLLKSRENERDAVPSMNLLVVRTVDLERSRAFYRNLGLDFRQEQHGDGPLHYSCDVAGTVVELYPTRKPTGGLRVGLRIPLAAKVLDELLSSGILADRAPVERREVGPDVYVIRDPDGNAVELEMI